MSSDDPVHTNSAPASSTTATDGPATTTGSRAAPAGVGSVGLGSASSIGSLRPDAMSARLAHNWWAIALRGVAAILFGLIALVVPGAAMLSLALVFAAYLLVDGVLGIISGIRAAQRDERWGWLVAEGVLNILMGVVAFLFPVAAVLAFVLVTAAWSLVTGALMIGAAFKLSHQHGRWWMLLSGVVSVIFGILLVIAPLIGAVVLTWWLGGYAIAFGVLLLVLGFKLRGQKNQGARSLGSPLSQGAQ